MNDQFLPTFVPATAEQILEIVRDEHRMQSWLDPEADPDAVLGRQSSSAQWRDACDLLPWRPLAAALNAAWQLDIPLSQWRAVLDPSEARTLGGVCDLLATHGARLPRVRPATLLGTRCVPAGVFLTVRSYLAQAGADVGDVAPSTPLAGYARRHAAVFLGPVARLVPGALPRVRMRQPIHDTALAALLLSMLGIAVGYVGDWDMLTILSTLAAAASYTGSWVAALWVKPARVEFEGLRTFGDLSLALAARVRV
ncbi:MAG TPA: hypothetical protein VGN72_09510 [Tepidisphaeraceae bacterium]|jgi:hypothetical protein|nr:hypothetical protein [Tepidisphaeraceae bacterium]